MAYSLIHRSGWEGVKRMKYLRWLAIFAALPANAQTATPQLTPQQLEERDQHLRNAIGLLEQVEVMADQIVAEKKVHCMKSVGNLQFCTCIANESPPAVSFVGYISATSLTNEELHYSSQSPDDRKAIDHSRAARVKCLGPVALN
jgi:hypothetical protein